MIISLQSNTNAVVEYLEKMCSNDINIPVGSIVHTGMQNEQGGYENDCILVRQSDDWYLLTFIYCSSNKTLL